VVRLELLGRRRVPDLVVECAGDGHASVDLVDRGADDHDDEAAGDDHDGRADDHDDEAAGDHDDRSSRDDADDERTGARPGPGTFAGPVRWPSGS
jgi:hypothetical protein